MIIIEILQKLVNKLKTLVFGKKLTKHCPKNSEKNKIKNKKNKKNKSSFIQIRIFFLLTVTAVTTLLLIRHRQVVSKIFNVLKVQAASILACLINLFKNKKTVKANDEVAKPIELKANHELANALLPPELKQVEIIIRYYPVRGLLIVMWLFGVNDDKLTKDWKAACEHSTEKGLACIAGFYAAAAAFIAACMTAANASRAILFLLQRIGIQDLGMNLGPLMVPRRWF